MASQAEIIRGNLRDNRERESQRQVAATDFSGRAPDPELNGIPSTSNDAALAAHLKETRDKSQEYARLQTEEARQQFEAQATANYRRDQANQSELKERAAIETMNRTLRERQDGLRAFSEFEAAAKLLDPAKTEWELPTDQLRDLAISQQKVIRTTGLDPLNFQENKASQPEVNRLQAHPTAFEDGSLYKLQNLPDGNIEVNLITGERFIGDPLTVARTIAESNVRTKLWARGKRPGEELPDFQSQPAEPPSENLGQEFTPSGSLADDLAARQRESVARSFGFSNADEMIQDYQEKTRVAEEAKSFIAEVKQERAITTFFTQHPEFPGTDAANAALGQILEDRGWEVDAPNLEAAHAIAVQRGLYQPVSAEAIAQANGQAPQRRSPAPPPMVRGNNPEISQGTGSIADYYNMPSAELRRLAIAQELNRSGPTYR